MIDLCPTIPFPMSARSPAVSIIIPCYNEQATIGSLLQALYLQTFPRQSMEVVVADGLSTDATRSRVEDFRSEHPDFRVRIVDNPQRAIPAALNRAIRAARGEYIIRLDAHSVPSSDYVERCVDALQAGHGDNVGGIWQIEPGGHGWLARSIAAAAGHPLGAGDAQYRHTNRAQHVDTVPFGAFHRALVDEVGMFDESLLTNEDYELNVRIRRAGKRIWLDPQIRSIYYARASLPALARQYLRYGFWKGRMLQRYPDTVRWRQFLPPAFVFLVLMLAILAPWWTWAGIALAVLLSIYLLALLAAGVQLAVQRREAALVAGVPIALGIMHFCWGGALLWSLVTGIGRSG